MYKLLVLGNSCRHDRQTLVILAFGLRDQDFAYKVFCVPFWIKALKTGSAFFGTLAALFYFYMVAAWGKHTWITTQL